MKISATNYIYIYSFIEKNISCDMYVWSWGWSGVFLDFVFGSDSPSIAAFHYRRMENQKTLGSSPLIFFNASFGNMFCRWL